VESQNAVLGVHCGHDAGACIIVNGKVIADAQEERFTRQKHCSGIPYQSVWFCLEQAGIEPSALKVVATSHRHFKLEHFFLFPETPIPELKAKPASLRQKLRGQSPTLPKQPEFVQIPGKVEPRLNQFYEGALKAPGYFNQVITNKCSFIRYGHHECHAATAYYTSKALKENREALVVVLDGIGDDISVSIWKGLDGRLQMIKEFGKEYSLGFFYSTVTEVLGYQVLDGEGTTMGQAPYGVYNEAIAETLSRYLPDLIKESPSIEAVGTVYRFDLSGSPHFHLNRVNKLSKELKGFEPNDIAFTAQKMLEKAVVRLVQHWQNETGINKVLLSGGVALNVKLNSVLAENGVDLEVFPNPGDGGLALGNALLGHRTLDDMKPAAVFDSIYQGCESSDDDIESYLKSRLIQYQKPENVFDAAADLLAQNKAIGWYQGKMESGPRALGNRSILMNPAKAENKDHLNKKVKYRQDFRPFCPSVLEGFENDLLKSYDGHGKFMIRAYRVTELGKEKMPAAVHADNTTRPQVVGDENPAFRELLQSFYQKTGIPALINTSMNVKGEPIAATHVDALKCFFSSGLDALVLGSFVVVKQGVESI